MARRYMPTSAQAIDPKAINGMFELAQASLCAPFELVGRFAVVTICGPLVQHGPAEFDDYDSIGKRVQAAIASPASAVILRINSPGGDAQGVFELARLIRASAGPKKIIAFADRMCASSAYAIASAADEIVIGDTAVVGSIGIYQPMVDTVAQDRAMGINFKVIASGTRKADGNQHVAITGDAEARIQADVDQLAAIFFATVNELRGTPVDALKALEGVTRIGVRAIADGLADRISTWADLTSDAPAASKPAEDNMDKEEARKALKAASDKDGGEWAKRALKAMDEDEKKEDDEKKALAAKAAEDEGKKKDEEKKDADAKASAMIASASGDTAKAMLALAAKVHQMEANEARREDEKAKAALFAKRPDFSEAVRATLAQLPIASVASAVETWPLAEGFAFPVAGAGNVAGTQGKGKVAPQATTEEAALIASAMGGSTIDTGVHLEGRTLNIGLMTPAQALEALARTDKELGR